MEIHEIPPYIGDLTLPVELELGTLSLSLANALALEEGAVLRTNQAAGAPLRVNAGGVELASAEAVVLNDKLCVRIAKIAEKPETAANHHGSR